MSKVSHGRGGAGNITTDTTPYVFFQHNRPHHSTAERAGTSVVRNAWKRGRVGLMVGKDLPADWLLPKYSYTDGGIVREGPVGDQGDGAFSTGRGGSGNIGSPESRPAAHGKDEDRIPEVALRDQKDKDYHVGRGGIGNEHHAHSKNDGHQDGHRESLIDKVKHKVLPKQ